MGNMVKQLIQYVIDIITISFALRLSAGKYCENDIFLKVESNGIVSCDFGQFDVVGWIYSTKDLQSTGPFIYLENSRIDGPESRSGKYSVLPNGSLTINNVTLQHEQVYTVRIVRNLTVNHFEIPVNVYVQPVPDYPVVNGESNQHVLIENSDGGIHVNCTMYRIRPTIPLEIQVISPASSRSAIYKTSSDLSTANNFDGTYNISLNSKVTIVNPWIGHFILQCRVAGNWSLLFGSVTNISLVQKRIQPRQLFPVVNNVGNQQHVELEAQKEDQLNCSIDSIAPYTRLDWEIIRTYPPDGIVFERKEVYERENEDGTHAVRSSITYRVTSDFVRHATLKCMVTGQTADLYPVFTTVGLQFSGTYKDCCRVPVVNGFTNQGHVVLDKNKEGELNCSLDSVSPNVVLEWSVITPDSDVLLDNQIQHRIKNKDGTHTITSLTTYKVISDSVPYVAFKCMVMDEESALYPVFTIVELHLLTDISDMNRRPVSAGEVLHFCISGVLCVLVVVFLIRWKKVKRNVSGSFTITQKRTHVIIGSDQRSTSVSCQTVGGDKIDV